MWLNVPAVTKYFGPKFISMIKNIIWGAQPLSSLAPFSHQPFTCIGGTRQGCPCSPLLFALSLEPIEQAIRESHVISPISIDLSKHYLSLYADDCLLFLSNIQESLPHVLNLFNDFHGMSGYKVNWSKSALLSVNSAAKDVHLPASIPICTSFTYLGIKIYPNLHQIVKENFYGVKKKKLEQDLKRWGSPSF